MRKKFFKLGVFLLLILVGFNGCGSKVDKANLNDEAYFEYAKRLLDEGNYFKAINEFNVIILKFSGSPVVDDAQFYLAEAHYKNEEYLIAASEYQKVMNDYSQSPYVEEAFFKIGLSYKQLSLRPELDQEYTDKGIRHLQNYIEAFPNGKFIERAEKNIAKLRGKMAEKKLLGANVYRKMGIYDSAIIYYNILLEKYYDTPAAEEAMFYKAECQTKLEKYQKALSNYSAFLEKYPKSKHADEAQSRITEIQDRLSKKKDS